MGNKSFGQTKLEYRGGNPDSREAWFFIDVSGSENEDVIVDSFIWNRKKSNENITDTRQGKGFSFYYARHAFDDEFSTFTYNEQNPENTKLLGIVDEKVMVVINYELENNNYRIISAWETDNQNLIEIYLRNKNKILKRKNNIQIQESILDFKNARFTSERNKNEVYEAVIKKIKDRQLFERIYRESQEQKKRREYE